MAEPTSAYKYTPSSSASTRQLIESDATSPTTTSFTSSTNNTTAPSSTSIPSRPANISRRSSNYADAAAAAKTAENDGKTGVAGWKPNFARKQSWSRQDAKRDLQMSVVGEGGGEGYSQAK